MNDLIPFQFGAASVRVVMVDGEPMFVARDVAEVLGYSNTIKAVNDHCKHGVTSRYPIKDSLGRDQHPTLIPERDVYRLIMRSKMSAAEAFEEWVVGEVLPSIRKTGVYKAPSPDPVKSPIAEISVDLCFAQAFISTFKVAESSKLTIFKKIGERHGADTSYLPAYAVDAPAGSLVGSSEVTAPITVLLDKSNARVSAPQFNLILERAGFLRRCERKTNQKRYAKNGGVKSFWTITQAGLEFGKNLVAPESPRETVPHWFVSRFDALCVAARPFYKELRSEGVLKS